MGAIWYSAFPCYYQLAARKFMIYVRLQLVYLGLIKDLDAFVVVHHLFFRYNIIKELTGAEENV